MILGHEGLDGTHRDARRNRDHAAWAIKGHACMRTRAAPSFDLGALGGRCIVCGQAQTVRIGARMRRAFSGGDNGVT